jgi:hypothetical protein
MPPKAKADPVAADDLVELQASEPLRLNGVDIAPGALFTTTPAQADQLVSDGLAATPLPPVLPE